MPLIVSEKMRFELNNNADLFEGYKRDRINENRVSISSGSSGCQSDSSEDVEALSRKSSTATLESPANVPERDDFRRVRAMSEGASYKIPNQEPFEVFPSLPDSVLEKMGLLGSGPSRERLSEEELEQKFVALSLAFTIDAATIKDRCERQRRYRDQTENNLQVEIDRLVQKANRIQPLCIDAETTELLSSLLAQIDIVARASTHATISSERYGAVQHENRISESVNLMINHVNLLKQQRDSARRQLQYTKRVLQNSNNNTDSTGPIQTLKQQSPTSNNKILTKRRASIATITQQSLELARNGDNKKITRRTSDLSLRASSLNRNSRPSRLELGVDLVKIKEGQVENEAAASNEPNQSDDNESCVDDNSSPETAVSHCERSENTTPLPLRRRLKLRLNRLKKKSIEAYNRWSNDGTMHEICCFCALMCFSISLIIMANIFIEFEYAKRGLEPSSSSFLWFWYTDQHNQHQQVAKKILQTSITSS